MEKELCLKIYKHVSVISGSKMKTCYKCKETLDKSLFGKLKSSPDGLRYDCFNCRKQYREQNKEQIALKQREYYQNNKEQLSVKQNEYNVANREKILAQRKEYRERPEIKEHQKQKNKEYLPVRCKAIKERRKTDLHFKLSEIIRSKVHKLLNGVNTSYAQIIGCDSEFLINWLEFRFDGNMNWSNFGTHWQIDHIVPINAFKNTPTNEALICFHWTNLQPLHAKVNQSKSDNIQLHYVMNNIVNVCRFNSKNTKFLGYQAVNESLRWLRINSGMVISPPMKSCSNFEIGNPQPSL